MTRENQNKILELRKAGKGYKSIATLLGLSVSTVQSFCKSGKKEPDDRCLQCGAGLIHVPKHKKKKFCSDKCRMQWWKSHADEVNRQAYYKFTCQYCGKEFISYGNNHRICCSRKCADSKRKEAFQRQRDV